MAFPCPPLNEQKRIVARVDQLMALCDNLEQSIAAAGEGRTALLSALMARGREP
jgi:type I restriction enzyme S subunit